MTARESAIDLIETYVKRGDNLDGLRKSCLGHASDKYWASIGGYIGRKKYNGNFIIVSRLGKKEVNEVFKYWDIVKEILEEAKPQTQTKQLQLL